jgi:cytochrome P450
MEGILIIATVAQTWKLRYLGTSPPALEPRITLRPEGTLDMKVERR